MDSHHRDVCTATRYRWKPYIKNVRIEKLLVEVVQAKKVRRDPFAEVDSKTGASLSNAVVEGR